MVGAVIVKDGRIIGEGYHQKCDEFHAERNALDALTESAEGATMYVTLEPCCHYGRTPPCTQAILENKIARVVIGSRAPNPMVAGKVAMTLDGKIASHTGASKWITSEIDREHVHSLRGHYSAVMAGIGISSQLRDQQSAYICNSGVRSGVLSRNSSKSSFRLEAF